MDEAGIRGRGRSSQEANLPQIGSPLGDLVAGEAHQVEDLRSIVRCLRRVVLDPDKGRAQVVVADHLRRQLLRCVGDGRTLVRAQLRADHDWGIDLFFRDVDADATPTSSGRGVDIVVR